MKILIDECVPRQLRGYITGHEVLSAQYAGFAGYKNGKLIQAAEDAFDLLITSDKNLRYQQNLTGRKLAILLLSTNNLNKIEQKTDKILSTINRMKPSQFVELEIS